MTTVRTVIHDRRIEIPAPEDLPDSTQFVLIIGTDVADPDGPMPSEEITRVLASMDQMTIDLNPRHWFSATPTATIGSRRGYAATRSLPAAGLQTLFVGGVSRRLADENR